jgi:hypothetical protein
MDTRTTAITACQECHLICQEALAYHGDEKGGKQLSSQHIKRLMAAIELCQVTADMLAIRAPLIDQLCELTARVLEQCATSGCQRCIHALYAASNHIKQAA